MTSRALHVRLCGVDRWLGIKMGWKRIGSVGNTAGPATMTSRAIGVSRRREMTERTGGGTCHNDKPSHLKGSRGGGCVVWLFLAFSFCCCGKDSGGRGRGTIFFTFRFAFSFA